MPGVPINPVDAATVAAMIAAATANGPQFVAASPMLVDELLANYPAGTGTRGKYARVTDYGGYIDRVLRCDYESSSSLYFWTPTQTDYARTIALSADMTHYALKSPNSVILSGTIGIGITRNVQIDMANRRPGEIIEFRNSMSSLLGTLNLLGTGIGTLVFNTLGGYARFVVDSSSGSLQLQRLQ